MEENGMIKLGFWKDLSGSICRIGKYGSMDEAKRVFQKHRQMR